MTPKKLFKILTGLLVLIVFSAFGLVWQSRSWLINRSSSITSAKLDVLELQSKYDLGVRARTDLELYKTLAGQIDIILPKNKDQVGILGQLNLISDELGVTINTINFPTSELGSTPVATPKPAADPTAAPTPTPTQNVTQAKPVESIPGVYSLQIRLDGITQKGSTLGPTYEQTLKLLDAIEHNQRTMQITSLGITPVKDTSGAQTYQVALTLNVFIKP